MGGHREPHQELALHLGDRDFHSRRREAYKIRISASSTPCTIVDSKFGHPADPSELPQSLSTKLVAKDSLRNLSGREAGPGAEAVDTITGDMMKDLTRRPDLCFGVLELASLRLEESEDIGYQVAEELNPQYEQYIGDSVYLWLQEAKEGARIVRRTTGYLAGAIGKSW
eukprot:s8874_g2.t1